MNERIKVLWLASWYPDKISPFNGDFVKRHAEAVSAYANVHVLRIARDEKGILTHDSRAEEFENGSLKETIVYYYSKRTGIALIDKILSEIKFRKVAKKYTREIIRKQNPDIVHVHVGLKMGVIAGWIKETFGLPYVVTEHWTGLLEESIDNFSLLSSFRRAEWKRVLKNANGVSVVSNHLAAALKKRFAVSPVVIPNVVNTEIFYPSPVLRKRDLSFIFISTFDEFKNPELVLEAFAGYLKVNQMARLTVFAPDKNVVINKCRQLGIDNNVDCSGEIPQTDLARFIALSDALLLYSSYETFGCVVVEANATGVPVIVSDIPAMRELVVDGINGMLVKPGDSQKLTEAMIQFETIESTFNKNEMARVAAERFNYSNVGKQFLDLYRTIISKS